ncbi:MAG TPA: HpcH/HpaI aldolase/citrate lyase family protein [Allosphingosinicella sp.]|jgi:citrate lyase beta subunit|uniref:HpcH/HpaI aldolase/citrate lyase family protein n=1 Tax=Allosphingosinicella sp. TaxID=2823234 RepID=UPI002F27E5BA
MSLDPLALGATLYLPAMRSDLGRIIFGGRVPGLRSAVLCLEDAVREEDVPEALRNLAAFLRHLALRGEQAQPLLFVRPRGPDMLAHVLRMPGADRLTGFVLPKATADKLPAYLALPLRPEHRLMPTLETREMFDPWEVRRLREQLLAVQDRVLALRIGGNDLLKALGCRRSTARTCYDGPLGAVIASLAGAFLPWGFALSAPVMERFDAPDLLRAEVARDIEHGLLTKTAIHPAQVPVIHAALAVAPGELADAHVILAADTPAVFAREGAMCEPATHRCWAGRLVRRAELFGVADPLPIGRRNASA